MSTKNEIKAELDELGIEYDSSANKDVLEKILEDNKKPKAPETPPQEPPVAPPTEPKKKGEKEQDIEVSDPLQLRPKELPLVIKGDWVNEEQAEYAKTLNAYAYKNPTKWAKKKDVLIKKLRALADEPENIKALRGIPEDAPKANITYSIKLHGS